MMKSYSAIFLLPVPRASPRPDRAPLETASRATFITNWVVIPIPIRYRIFARLGLFCGSDGAAANGRWCGEIDRMAAMAASEAQTRRPRQRDADATRARILAAAKKEFALSGLGGARVDKIADRAKANKRMIYH
jgi:hypothetical protein